MTNLTVFLQEIADAIKLKKGYSTTHKIPAASFAEEIVGLEKTWVTVWEGSAEVHDLSAYDDIKLITLPNGPILSAGAITRYTVESPVGLCCEGWGFYQGYDWNSYGATVEVGPTITSSDDTKAYFHIWEDG